ncbi:tripartite tricarboxylate transporter substrate binding protein [Starkeya koreensis]|uniref:Tripartite tricarboxylate transporter substrate binding protein n=1 Tax=Ancylobacter koreensis TaxID=266121 RepID=A0ABT0DRF8_9HYPH|nr:tripartite tricarboxylate transporter substrate-binding protein [Ancylobacter koreensis]MCK0209764.1 tripartite tricarboxylate transporter substrate binding protein [Ancylobacter koreensis]
MNAIFTKFALVGVVSAMLTGGALALPQKTECLAGAKPGGGFDVTCRLAANSLLAAKLIETPMAVTYMEGGVGAIAYNHVVGKRAADPSLIVAASTGSALLLAQGKFGNHDENAVRWIGALGADYGVIVVGADSPYKTLKELSDAYAANPGQFPIGGGGAVGSQDWMKAALIAKGAGQDPKKMRYVALEGGGAVLTSLEGGHIKIGAGDASEMVKHHQAGKVRILAVMSPERLAGDLADIPTAREQGYDFDWVIWRGYYTGGKVSDADYTAWADTFRKLVATPEFKAELAARGLFPYTLIGPDFDAKVKSDVQRFKALAKEAGL